MRVVCITMNGCSKCKQAEAILKDYPIEWLNIDEDKSAGDYVWQYDLQVVPTFIVYEEDELPLLITNILEMRSIFEEAEGKA